MIYLKFFIIIFFHDHFSVCLFVCLFVCFFLFLFCFVLFFITGSFQSKKGPGIPKDTEAGSLCAFNP